LVGRLASAYHLALDRYFRAIWETVSAENAGDSPQNSIPAPMAPDADAVLASLAGELQQTRKEWLSAVVRCNAVTHEAPSGIPHPDGSMRIRKAGRQRALAFRKYQQALARFNAAANTQPY
jgi:hypothetical protein